MCFSDNKQPGMAASHRISEWRCIKTIISNQIHCKNSGNRHPVNHTNDFLFSAPTNFPAVLSIHSLVQPVQQTVVAAVPSEKYIMCSDRFVFFIPAIQDSSTSKHHHCEDRHVAFLVYFFGFWRGRRQRKTLC